MQAGFAADGVQESGWSWRKKAGARLAFGAVLAVMAAAIFPAGARGKAPDSLSTMPEAPAKQMIATKCGSACHGAARVFDHSRTRDEWTDTVVLMRDYGANVSVDEQKTIVAYLTENFGHAPAPAKPASPAPATNARGKSSSQSGASASNPSQSSPAAKPAAKSSPAVKPASASSSPASGGASSSVASGGLPPGPGKELVQTKCTMCHNLDRVIGSHRTPAEWQELVTTMQEYGADVYDQDEKTVVNYLAKSFPAAGSSSKGAAGSGGPAK